MKYKQNRIQEYRKQNYGINTNHTKYDNNGNISNSFCFLAITMEYNNFQILEFWFYL